jgi:C4-dicarboxylate-specific signal transduction histidine kinase
VLDLTERKRAEAEARESERQYREMQMQLAHANRVAAMGQLTASIAHEMKQPITATITNAQAALRFLDGRSPDPEEVRQALACIVKDGHRAGNVIGRIRDQIKKAPPQEERLDINEMIREVIDLIRSEAMKNDVSVRPDLAEGLPLVRGDRVQLQQVILNLIINALGNERRRGHARIADQHPESRERGRAGRGAGFGSWPGLSESRARLRVLLHDQAERFGAGAADLPVDHRSARRTIVGERERAPRRPLSVHGACVP